jgi:hypothetical protein
VTIIAANAAPPLLLHQAECRSTAGRTDESWYLLHASQRANIRELPVDQLALRAHAVLHESQSKLSGWRLEQARDALASTGLLTQEVFASGNPGEAAPQKQRSAGQGVAEAMRMLHENSQNTYLRMQLLARRLVMVAGCLLAVLASVGLAATFFEVPSAPDPRVAAA